MEISDENKDDGTIGCVIIVLIAGFFIGLIAGLLTKDDYIRSDEKVEPTIELSVKEGNIIDTTYIYKPK